MEFSIFDCRNFSGRKIIFSVGYDEVDGVNSQLSKLFHIYCQTIKTKTLFVTLQIIGSV